MKALLVYPEHLPRTYWSFSGALPYIERRAALPPLGLVTVAAMLPEHWELRLIDMNVAPLRDADLLWADVVLTSTMVVQAPSLDEVVARCNRLGVPVAAGGPYPSISPECLHGVDHVFAPTVSPKLTTRRCRDSIFSTSKRTPRWRYSIRAAVRFRVSFATSGSSTAAGTASSLRNR